MRSWVIDKLDFYEIEPRAGQTNSIACAVKKTNGQQNSESRLDR